MQQYPYDPLVYWWLFCILLPLFYWLLFSYGSRFHGIGTRFFETAPRSIVLSEAIGLGASIIKIVLIPDNLLSTLFLIFWSTPLIVMTGYLSQMLRHAIESHRTEEPWRINLGLIRYLAQCIGLGFFPNVLWKTEPAPIRYKTCLTLGAWCAAMFVQLYALYKNCENRHTTVEDTIYNISFVMIAWASFLVGSFMRDCKLAQKIMTVLECLLGPTQGKIIRTRITSKAFPFRITAFDAKNWIADTV